MISLQNTNLYKEVTHFVLENISSKYKRKYRAFNLYYNENICRIITMHTIHDSPRVTIFILEYIVDITLRINIDVDTHINVHNLFIQQMKNKKNYMFMNK